MDKPIEEGRMLLLKNKDKVFKNYFFDSIIILLVLAVSEMCVSIFITKSFYWWEIPIDIALCVIISLISAWLQVRWNRHHEQENAYFKEKYGKK